MLSALAAKLLDHSKFLATIFNNKTVVDAFMSRKRAKENCASGGALKSYLSDPNSGGMTALASSPKAAGVLSGLQTKMAARTSLRRAKRPKITGS